MRSGIYYKCVACVCVFLPRVLSAHLRFLLVFFLSSDFIKCTCACLIINTCYVLAFFLPSGFFDMIVRNMSSLEFLNERWCSVPEISAGRRYFIFITNTNKAQVPKCSVMKLCTPYFIRSIKRGWSRYFDINTPIHFPSETHVYIFFRFSGDPT